MIMNQEQIPTYKPLFPVQTTPTTSKINKSWGTNRESLYLFCNLTGFCQRIFIRMRLSGIRLHVKSRTTTAGRIIIKMVKLSFTHLSGRVGVILWL
jgi:aspartyl/asparaginyl beta-hydroxylase (cupin superfamily)